MGEVDPAFIQAIEHRPQPASTEANTIPTIDLSLVSSLDHLSDTHVVENIACLISEIGDACEKWGFFQVVHHGVSLDKLHKLELAARTFFGLSLQEKRKVSRDEFSPLGYYDTEHTKNVRDWKEVFDFIFPVESIEAEAKQIVNRWPEYPSELREVAEDYGKEVEKLGFKLLELIALSLGLEAGSFNDHLKRHISLIRLNHFPPCPFPDLALGVGRHKDPGALTILHQDEVGGLQVRRKSDDEWVSVKPTPGAFIVNVGDIIQVWSNDKYESVEHRVLVNSDKERLSIPYFFNPSHSVMVKPFPGLISHKNPAKYREYNWGEYITARGKGNFKKLDVENIQISHFKIITEEEINCAQTSESRNKFKHVS